MLPSRANYHLPGCRDRLVFRARLPRAISSFRIPRPRVWTRESRPPRSTLARGGHDAHVRVLPSGDLAELPHQSWYSWASCTRTYAVYSYRYLFT
jgi:hypothetical protein